MTVPKKWPIYLPTANGARQISSDTMAMVRRKTRGAPLLMMFFTVQPVTMVSEMPHM